MNFYKLCKDITPHLKRLELKSGRKKIRCRFGSTYWTVSYFNFIQHRDDIINKAHYDIRRCQYQLYVENMVNSK